MPFQHNPPPPVVRTPLDNASPLIHVKPPRHTLHRPLPPIALKRTAPLKRPRQERHPPPIGQAIYKPHRPPPIIAPQFHPHFFHLLPRFPHRPSHPTPPHRRDSGIHTSLVVPDIRLRHLPLS